MTGRGWRCLLVAVALASACAPIDPPPPPSPVPVSTGAPPAGAPPGQGPLAEDLTTSARAKARAGDCDSARALADRVRVLDPDYYRAFVVPDPVITRCWSGKPPSTVAP